MKFFFYFAVLSAIAAFVADFMGELPFLEMLATTPKELWALIGLSVLFKIGGAYASAGHVFKWMSVNVACFLVAMLIIPYSVLITYKGQAAIFANSDFQATNNTASINDKIAERDSKQRSVDRYVELGAVTKAKPLQADIERLNQQISSLRSGSKLSASQAIGGEFESKLVAGGRAVLSGLLGCFFTFIAASLYRVIYGRISPGLESTQVQKTLQPWTYGRTQESMKVQGGTDSKKKSKSTVKNNGRTDQEIVACLKDWRAKNPSKKIENQSELKKIVGIGYSRIQRMKKDNIDLLAIANESQSRSFKILSGGK